MLFSCKNRSQRTLGLKEKRKINATKNTTLWPSHKYPSLPGTLKYSTWTNRKRMPHGYYTWLNIIYSYSQSQIDNVYSLNNAVKRREWGKRIDHILHFSYLWLYIVFFFSSSSFFLFYILIAPLFRHISCSGEITFIYRHFSSLHDGHIWQWNSSSVYS